MTDEEGQAPHPTSVAVWGAPSPVIAASRFTVTVGVKCAAGHPLAGRPVVIRDEAGRDVGHGTLGAEPRAGTRALYAAAVSLTAPSEPGVHAWTAAFPGAGEAGLPAHGPTPPPEPATEPVPHREAASAPKREAPSAPQEAAAALRREAAAPAPAEGASPSRNEPVAATPHEADSAMRQHAAAAPGHVTTAAPGHVATAAPGHVAAGCTFSFRTVEPPGNTVTVTVVDQDTETPLAAADVHLGVYRASTDAEGKARVQAPAGEYELYVRSPGYVPYAEPVTVTGDAALHVAAARVSEADLDDDQVWM